MDNVSNSMRCMNALTNKWETVKAVALRCGVRPDTIRKWKEPGRGIPARLHIKLIRESGGRLCMADFVDGRQESVR